MKKIWCTLFAMVLITIAVNAQRIANNNLRLQRIERINSKREEKILRRRQYLLSRKIRTQHLPAKKEQQLNNTPIKDSTINKN